MTVVLLLPGRGGRDIAEQLRRLPTRAELDVRPVDRFAEALGSAPGPVAIVCGDLLTTDGALLRILDDPSLTLATLVSSAAGAHPVATSGAAVLAVAAAEHVLADADADAVGALFIGTDLVDPAAELLAGIDDFDLAVATLVRAERMPPMAAVRVEPFPAVRTGDPTATLPEVDADLAARFAARPADGFYSTFVLRPISSRITPWAVRCGVSANAVTVVSFLVGLGGAAAFAFGTYPALVAGALLLQISLVFDCVDGEIARATRTSSPFGAWLDGATDRVKEYAALAGLAVAADVRWWWAATAAMIVQTARHIQDYAFDKGALAEWRRGHRDQRPMTDTALWVRPPGLPVGVPERRETPGVWLRRLLHMPIAERWLALSVCALADRPWLGLLVYLVLTSLAWAWTTAGALLRSRTLSRYSGALRRRLGDLRDDGALRLRTHSPDGVLGWALPSLLTAGEGALVVVLTAACAPEWRAAAFGWFAVVAWHRYDVAYRATRPPPALTVLGGGWLLRSAALGVGALLGILPAVLVGGTCWLFAVYVPESLLAGGRAGRLGR